ncbi:MAG TPA: iron-sulfur cluster assembly accessory protein [Terrimicrobiaceae bacterium]|jgi:iron-sulfur cluster assembly accessory protein|nr:iron-sulfur cluster assembly accessory protein [Terrimicrobiaceae bacterium]
MVEFTASAAAQLHVLVQEKGLDTKTTGLRLSVEKGGCAGLQYAMSLGALQENDLIVERDNARLFIDAESLQWLDNSVIDYEEGLSGAGFRVRNPLSARSCGCGTSFEPAGSARS